MAAPNAPDSSGVNEDVEERKPAAKGMAYIPGDSVAEERTATAAEKVVEAAGLVEEAALEGASPPLRDAMELASPSAETPKMKKRKKRQGRSSSVGATPSDRAKSPLGSTPGDEFGDGSAGKAKADKDQGKTRRRRQSGEGRGSLSSKKKQKRALALNDDDDAAAAAVDDGKEGVEADASGLPLARVKRLMKDSVKELAPALGASAQPSISGEAAAVMAKSAALFLGKLAELSGQVLLSDDDGRTSLVYRHIATSVSQDSTLQFLSDVVPSKLRVEHLQPFPTLPNGTIK